MCRHKSNKKFYHCGRLGQFKKDCYDFKRKQNDHDNAELNNSTGLDLNSLHVITVSSGKVSKDWILASIKSRFYNYKDIEHRKVYMGENNTQTIVEIGDIAIKMHDVIFRPIKNVRMSQI